MITRTRAATQLLAYDLFENSNKAHPRVIFLHGFVGCRQDWQAVIAQCTDRFACLSVDLPGHGESSTIPDSPAGLDSSTDAVVRLMDHLQWDSASLVGYSMGGRLGLHLACSLPARVDRLVLVSASPGLRTELEGDERRRSDEDWAAKLASQPLAEWLRAWYQQPLFESLMANRAAFDSLWSRRLAVDPIGLAWSLRFMGTGAQKSLWDSLSRLQHRALLVAGERDSKFRAIAHEMASQLPLSQTAVIKDCGHVVHIEQPLLLAERVKQFLSQDR